MNGFAPTFFGRMVLNFGTDLFSPFFVLAQKTSPLQEHTV